MIYFSILTIIMFIKQDIVLVRDTIQEICVYNIAVIRKIVKIVHSIKNYVIIAHFLSSKIQVINVILWIKTIPQPQAILASPLITTLNKILAFFLHYYLCKVRQQLSLLILFQLHLLYPRVDVFSFHYFISLVTLTIYIFTLITIEIIAALYLLSSAKFQIFNQPNGT